MRWRFQRLDDAADDRRSSRFGQPGQLRYRILSIFLPTALLRRNGQEYRPFAYGSGKCSPGNEFSLDNLCQVIF
jgi:hypothetical protein